MEVIKFHDCSVMCGHRSAAEQLKAFRTNRSKLMWPDSKHNKSPSIAIDVSPFPIDWKNYKRFYYFIGIVMGIAHKMGIKIRAGHDWDMDNDLDDQTFNDLVHFELIE